MEFMKNPDFQGLVRSHNILTDGETLRDVLTKETNKDFVDSKITNITDTIAILHNCLDILKLSMTTQIETETDTPPQESVSIETDSSDQVEILTNPEPVNKENSDLIGATSDLIGATFFSPPAPLHELCTNKICTKVFLGGSILDWPTVNVCLSDLPIYVFNPSQADLNPTASDDVRKEQIVWEIDAQVNSDVRFYCFDTSFINPITFLELGLFSRKDLSDQDVVYCHPECSYKISIQYICKITGIPYFETFNEALEKLRELIYVHNASIFKTIKNYEIIKKVLSPDKNTDMDMNELMEFMKFVSIMGLDKHCDYEEDEDEEDEDEHTDSEVDDEDDKSPLEDSFKCGKTCVACRTDCEVKDKVE